MNKRQRFAILRRDRFTCQYGGRRPPEVVLEVDHRYSRAIGGPDGPANYVTACFDCNRGKRDDVVGGRWQRFGGPLDGEHVTTDRRYPVDWVYQFPTSRHLSVFEDEWDPKPYEDLYGFAQVLMHGQPGLRRDTSARWHEGYEQYGEYPDLIGFYVIGNIVRGDSHLPLIWQSPVEFISYQLTFGEGFERLDPADVAFAP